MIRIKSQSFYEWQQFSFYLFQLDADSLPALGMQALLFSSCRGLEHRFALFSCTCLSVASHQDWGWGNGLLACRRSELGKGLCRSCTKELQELSRLCSIRDANKKVSSSLTPCRFTSSSPKLYWKRGRQSLCLSCWKIKTSLMAKAENLWLLVPKDACATTNSRISAWSYRAVISLRSQSCCELGHTTRVLTRMDTAPLERTGQYDVQSKVHFTWQSREDTGHLPWD